MPTKALEDGVRAAVALGHECTEEQDVAFGFRQLADIGIKAISPAINDPTTAAEAIGYCADLLVLLQGRGLGPQVKRDDDGVPVVRIRRDSELVDHAVPRLTVGRARQQTTAKRLAGTT